MERVRGKFTEPTASFLTPSLMGTCFASKSLGKSLMTLFGRTTLGPNSLQETEPSLRWGSVKSATT